MHLENLRDYLLSKPGATEDFPFDENTLVFKVKGKMFGLMPLEALPLRISLKCNPERALELRETYAAIEGAYHMNKTHWNGIMLDGTVPSELIRELIDHSYDLVVAKLNRADRADLLKS